MLKNKKMMVGLGVSLLAVLILVAFVLIGGGANQEAKLSKKLETAGADFYENFYYDQVTNSKTDEEIEDFLGRFEDIGIKVDIDNLSRFDEDKYPNFTAEFVNKKADITCDVRNTRAIIYPNSPYGKTDFTVKAELDCGFDVAPNNKQEKPKGIDIENSDSDVENEEVSQEDSE